MDKKNKSYQKKENKTFWDSSIYTSTTEEKPEEKPILDTKIIEEVQEVKEEKSSILYKVRVTCPLLRIRTGPSTGYESIGIIYDNGIYPILEEQNGFGKIAENQWIMLCYTDKA